MDYKAISNRLAEDYHLLDDAAIAIKVRRYALRKAMDAINTLEAFEDRSVADIARLYRQEQEYQKQRKEERKERKENPPKLDPDLVRKWVETLKKDARYKIAEPVLKEEEHQLHPIEYDNDGEPIVTVD